MSFGLARVAPEKAAFRPALPVSFKPGVNGTHMTKMTYAEQLKHPNWQKKRLEILQRDEFKCQRCYDGESTLHVHHKHYHKGAMVWEYQNFELVTLCESCHEATHQEGELRKTLFAQLPMDGPRNENEILAFAAGFACSRAPEIDADGFMTLDTTAFCLGFVANRLEDTIGYAVRDNKDFARRVALATDEEMKAWIASLQPAKKE